MRRDVVRSAAALLRVCVQGRNQLLSGTLLLLLLPMARRRGLASKAERQQSSLPGIRSQHAEEGRQQ